MAEGTKEGRMITLTRLQAQARFLLRYQRDISARFYIAHLADESTDLLEAEYIRVSRLLAILRRWINVLRTVEKVGEHLN